MLFEINPYNPCVANMVVNESHDAKEKRENAVLDIANVFLQANNGKPTNMVLMEGAS